MKIIIAGVGEVGYAIARQMEGENHDLVLIDRSPAALQRADSSLDTLCVQGNGAAVSVLIEAGVREADLVIAVTENDEENLICCLMAKKLGAKRTVARVRNPEYFQDASILRREIGLNMIINPEDAAAQEIARILRVPAAFSVESFARGIVELIGFQVTASDKMAGKSLIDYNSRNPNSLLLCAAKRGEEVIVPDAHFVPLAGDLVYAVSTPRQTLRVFKAMGREMTPVRRVSVFGGGRTTLYLAWALESIRARLCVVERDEERCLTLAERLPKATVIHGDGADHELIDAEGIFDCDAFVALTDRDEENLLVALRAQRAGVKKVLPRLSSTNYMDLVTKMGIESVISPKDVTSSQISSYVRATANSQGSAVEGLHKLLGGAMEAVEFTATAAARFLNTPLRDLRLRRGLLVAAIVHDNKMEIPGGNSRIQAGDRVIVVARTLFLKDLNDILER